MISRRPQAAMLALTATTLFHAYPAAASDGAENAAPAPQQAEREGSGATAREVYLPEDFARYAPRNAADMLEEIPGFTISGGEGGSRGFGQADENVLINGSRISSKSTSTAEQLARIPVGNVLRIEVVDGATLDIPGLSGRVANIIVQQGGLSGQFEWQPQLSTGPGNPNLFEGEVSLTGAKGPVDFTIALENRAFARGSEGPAIFTDRAGMVDARNNWAIASFNRPSLSGQFAFDIAPGVAANLNLTGGLQRFRSREEERRVAGNPLDPFLERFRATNDERFYEIAADIEFPLGPGRLKLIGLEAFEHGDFLTRSLLDLGDKPSSGSKFTRLSDSGERIGRAEYGWAMLGADWQLSGEAAFNRLDQVGRLFSYDPNVSQYVEIPFPSGVGGVREDRYETLLSVGFPITDNLSVQLIGGGEYSQIALTGADPNTRTFKRPKGSVSIAWALGEGFDINLEVARRVGQLDFGDFLASVDLSDDQANAGNNQLRPEQIWNIELQLARNFGELGSATLTLFEERISDLVLIVPLASGGEARGNIESARRRGVDFVGTLQLERLGVAGGQLEVSLDWEDSSLIDPVTALERRFDRNDPFEIAFDFRHDVPDTNWAWGWLLRDAERAPSYRVREEILDFGPSTAASIFVEHKNVLGATANLRISNLAGGTETLRRTVFDGPRDAAPVLFSENRLRDRGQEISLTITGNF